MDTVFAHWPPEKNPDGVQIFLPWSWINPRPDAVLSHNLSTVVSPYYFPYNKYIFQRAILQDEECQEETECTCWHLLPDPAHRHNICWYDWPCGCKRAIPIYLTPQFLAGCNSNLASIVSEIQMNKAYIVSQVIHDGIPRLACFAVVPRMLWFPQSKKRKRKSGSGRTLSLTDRKYYKMGRYNPDT